MEIGKFQELKVLYVLVANVPVLSQDCCSISPWRCNWSIYTWWKMKNQILGSQPLGLMLQPSLPLHRTCSQFTWPDLPGPAKMCSVENFSFNNSPERVQVILNCSPICKIIDRYFILLYMGFSYISSYVFPIFNINGFLFRKWKIKCIDTCTK